MIILRTRSRHQSPQAPHVRKWLWPLAMLLALIVAIGAQSMATAVSGNIAVPDVVGQQKSDARVVLEGAGLQAVNKMMSSSLPAESVVSTSPAAGTMIAAGTKIFVYWSDGKGTATPSPTPTASPTATSSPTPTASPTSTPTAPAGSPATASGGYADARDGGVTGGGNAAPVTVRTASEMQAAIDSYDGTSGLALRYTGTFDFGSITDVCAQWTKPAGTIVAIKGKSNVTIEGASGSAANFGLDVAGNSQNIIIHNMEIGLLPGSIDAIGIEGTSSGKPSGIWVDHNSLSSALVHCDGAGDLSFDGLLDIKGGAHDVTVSYNYIHDHVKVGLVGHSDSDLSTTHITYHHNYYRNVGSRIPLERGGLTHMYNNLYSDVTTSGINVRMGGYALIEGNHFENATNPVTSRDSPNVGYWQLNGNNITSPADFAIYGIKWGSCSGSCLKNATDWKTTAQFPEAIPYSYTPAIPSCVKQNLPAVAGAGKGLATLSCLPTQ